MSLSAADNRKCFCTIYVNTMIWVSVCLDSVASNALNRSNNGNTSAWYCGTDKAFDMMAKTNTTPSIPAGGVPPPRPYYVPHFSSSGPPSRGILIIIYF